MKVAARFAKLSYKNDWLQAMTTPPILPLAVIGWRQTQIHRLTIDYLWGVYFFCLNGSYPQ